MDLGEDQVFVGVGSDDVLAHESFLTFFNSDKPVLFPDVTYSFYKVWADLFKVPFETPALKEDFTIDVKDYAKGKRRCDLPKSKCANRRIYATGSG